MLCKILITATAAMFFTSVAHAEIVSIPGAAFYVGAPEINADLNSFPDLENGKLKTNSMQSLVAPVDFPKNGQRICKMTLVFEDYNGNQDMTVQLAKKPALTGGNADGAPVVLASVSSNGNAIGVTRSAATTAISPRKVNDKNGFYFLQTSFINTNLNIIGVMLDVRGTCP